ncbi:MAG: ATP-binding protein [Gammaproteobacteria bacterium]|nr:ATP-binding protein [Gammaproteobacteria bacterium]
MPLDLFAEVSRIRLTKADAKNARKAVADGRLDGVFPAGSAARPLLLVGREPQIERLNGLGAELLAGAGSAKHNRIAVALHGPRGVGKTVLLDTFANAVLKRGAMVIADVGDALSSEERLIRFIQTKIAPDPEVTKTLRGKAGLDGFGVGGDMTWKSQGGRPELGSVKDALEALIASHGAGKPKPTLITLDEAHNCDPLTLGKLLNASQKLNGQGWPIIIAIAGTPDLLDVLGDAHATWFMDRNRSDRLMPVGNLTDVECAQAISAPLDALGVGYDREALHAAAEWCWGSPYFSQSLGLCALRTLDFAGGKDARADFSREGPIRQSFRQDANGRYFQAWTGIDQRGLTSCARQLGMLWRWSKAVPGRVISTDDVDAAVQSGLRHPPSHRVPEHSTSEAERYFRHLGLLWDPAGGEGRWELGLPSFFDYAEAIYQSKRRPRYHSKLADLDADLETVIPWDASFDEDVAGITP